MTGIGYQFFTQSMQTAYEMSRIGMISHDLRNTGFLTPDTTSQNRSA